jgi:hypothetical protein
MNNISTPEKKLAAQSASHRLLRIGQSVLNKHNLAAKEQHRTVWCGRSFKFGDSGTGEDGFVDVYRNPDRDGANFAGLNRCGCIHTCPICSGKIGELRRKQLSAAAVRHCKDNGGGMYLLTFTFPHYAEFGDDSLERLKETIQKLNKARDSFKNSRLWKSFQKSAGNIQVNRKNKAGEVEQISTVGAVTSLEFTISSENGWHPHLHTLIFCKKQGFGSDEKTITEETGLFGKDDIASYMIEELKHAWVAALFKVGLGDNSKLTDMMKRALNVRGGEHAAEYIAKMGREQTIFVDSEGNRSRRWTLAREVACTHSKKGSAGERWGVQHVTPFQLLAWCEKQANETKEQRDERAWAFHRFTDYAAAVEGKRALTWTPGLKIALGVEDVDEKNWLASDQPLPEQIHVGRLNAAQFSTVLASKKTPEFLEYVATCCDKQEHLDEYIEMLEQMPRVASGAVMVKRREGRAVLYQ